MTITYHGHSTFKLKGKRGTVVTDPYNKSVGFELPTMSADIVTVSHEHDDHNNADAVRGTSRRDQPFVIRKPGEYEVGGISVFGVGAYHDSHKGEERGASTIYTILLDELRVCHLGDLGHELTQQHIDAIGVVDVLLIPVGGKYTITAGQAVKVIRSLEPSIVIPMHYKTEAHDQATYGEMTTQEDFLKEYGVDVQPEAKLEVEYGRLPEETEVVPLVPQL